MYQSAYTDFATLATISIVGSLFRSSLMYVLSPNRLNRQPPYRVPARSPDREKFDLHPV